MHYAFEPLADRFSASGNPGDKTFVLKMPKSNRKRRRNRRRKRAGNAAPQQSSGQLRLIPHEFVATLAPPVEVKESKDDWLSLSPKKEEKTVSLSAVRSLFPADTSFTTSITYMGQLSTSAAGSINFQLPVTNISTVAEWSSLNALFDEFYVHEMSLEAQPYNKFGTLATSAAGTYPVIQTAASGATFVMAVGVVATALQGPAAYYSSAAALANNPAALTFNTADSFRYVWNNTVRYDPHGMTFSSTTSTNGWQGWTQVQDSAQYGGTIQIRAINDQPMGDGAHAVNIGGYILRWRVSFRSRA